MGDLVGFYGIYGDFYGNAIGFNGHILGFYQDLGGFNVFFFWNVMWNVLGFYWDFMGIHWEYSGDIISYGYPWTYFFQQSCDGIFFWDIMNGSATCHG